MEARVLWGKKGRIGFFLIYLGQDFYPFFFPNVFHLPILARVYSYTSSFFSPFSFLKFFYRGYFFLHILFSIKNIFSICTTPPRNILIFYFLFQEYSNPILEYSYCISYFGPSLCTLNIFYSLSLIFFSFSFLILMNFLLLKNH